ncbi:MAG: hypothetical protein ACREMQ_24005 [Longimicrobiales bacterium]
MTSTDSSSARWLHYGAAGWAVIFAAPHIWWALGMPAGMPGGPASHELMMTTWRYYFDVLVIVLSALAVLVALAPVQTWGTAVPRRLLRALAYAASFLLTFRGVGGLIIDGASDPVWWPIFLAGGLLFGAIALRRPSSDPLAPRPGSRRTA